MTSDESPNTETATDKKRAQDFDDLQHELAGLETGRLKRFFNGTRDPASTEKERKAREQTLHSVLEAMLLADPDYAKLYHDTWAFMVEAEKQAETILTSAEQAMDEILNDAVRLSDDQAVFMDVDGNIRTENGDVIDAALAGGLFIPDGAPSYEDYQEAKDLIDKVRHYQIDVLGYARERLSDHENPPDKEEVGDIYKNMRDGMDTISQRAEDKPEAASSAHQQHSDIALPTLGD